MPCLPGRALATVIETCSPSEVGTKVAVPESFEPGCVPLIVAVPRRAARHAGAKPTSNAVIRTPDRFMEAIYRSLAKEKP